MTKAKVNKKRTAKINLKGRKKVSKKSSMSKRMVY